MIVRSMLFSTVWIVALASLAVGRCSAGYQGARREILAPDWDHRELWKRAPMGFQGMRGKKNSIIGQLEDELFPEEAKRRAPMGFQGTRGKKSDSMNDFAATYSLDGYEKRAPIGFRGSRGKKPLEEILKEIERKFDDSRTGGPTAFDYRNYRDGTRFPPAAYRVRNSPFLRELEKKAPMGFQGTRGKKTIVELPRDTDGPSGTELGDWQRNARNAFDEYLDYSMDPSGHEKRSAAYRGDAGESGEEPGKRSRMGFHGMRGKRDATRNPVAEWNVAGAAGRRGNDPDGYPVEKRSPLGYPAVRGKKNPRWAFRGKFVGVRGKKTSASRAGQQPAF